MAAGRVALRRQGLAGQEGVVFPGNPHKSIAKQQSGPQFRRRHAKHPDFQIDQPLPKHAGLLVRLQHKADADMGGGFGHRGDERRRQEFKKRFAHAHRERRLQRGNVDLAYRRPQNGSRILGDGMNPILKRLGKSCRHERPACSDEQWIACDRSQPRQRTAHGGRAEPQPLCRFGHAPFGQQDVKRDEKIKVDLFHAEWVD